MVKVCSQSVLLSSCLVLLASACDGSAGLHLSSTQSASTSTFQSGANGYSSTVDGLIRSDTGTGANDFGGTSTLIMINTTGGYEAEALIRFDNLSLPAGSTVTSASVDLTFEDFSGGHDLRGYYVKNPWTTAAKWVPRDATHNWNTPGAKGSGTDISSTPAFTDTSGWTGAGVIAKTYPLDVTTVQGWIDTPSTNQGLVLMNAASNKTLRVYTAENATAAYHPKLTINYTTGGGGTDAGVDAGASCTSIATGTWHEDAFTAQSAFTAEFDATPSAVNVDEVMGFSSGSASQTLTNLQAIARFFTNGRIEARNGGSYTADNVITYAAGTSYHFKFVINVATRTYSVYVTPAGGSEVAVGENYAFRADAPPNITSLDRLASEAGSGTLQVCNVSTGTTTYNSLVLADNPVAFWGMTGGGSSETDLSGNGRTGSYVNGTPTTSTMPNGDPVVVFNGEDQLMTVASHASLSIPTTQNLTWEAWIRPTVLDFPKPVPDKGYVNFLGKCEIYSPTCEWEARMYNPDPPEPDERCNRLSAYAFNPDADKGAGADFQPTCGLLVAGHWYHVVGEYTTTTVNQPAICDPDGDHPGTINIWVNGVKWAQSFHNDTGCMSQYSVTPTANNSSFRVGTVAGDGWFPGAIGKVAIYDYLLTDNQITAHYEAMTGQVPSGSCGSDCTLTNP